MSSNLSKNELTCPHCKHTFNDYEEATIGKIENDSLPHIMCPSCNQCIGCLIIKDNYYDRC